MISADVDVPAAQLFSAMNDLGTYGEWMALIDRCDVADPHESDTGPAWVVTLKAKVGPFARSKRLRMVRVESLADSSVRFERRELDGKEHSAWTMEAAIQPGSSPDESAVTVELTYSGGLWSGPLDAVLGTQVDAARDRLRAYLEK